MKSRVTVNFTSSTCLGSLPATLDWPGSQYFASPVMVIALRLRSASAPPSALTASLTRLWTGAGRWLGCAEAGCDWHSTSSNAAEMDRACFMRLPPRRYRNAGLVHSPAGGGLSLVDTLASTASARTGPAGRPTSEAAER